MARDARWPFLPVLIVRAVQALFAVIVLGTAGYLTGQWNPPIWWTAFGLVTALLTLIYIAINFVLLFMGLLLPLAVVIVDAFLLLFWIISLAGAGADGFVGSSCKYSYSSYSLYDYDIYSYTSTPCVVGKAMFAMELLSMFLFIGSLAYASIILHKNRKDLRGKKYRASGHNPEAGNVVPMIPQGNLEGTAEQKHEYYATTTTGTPAPTQIPVYGGEQQQQQQQQPYYTGQGQTPAPYVQGPPAQFVSPPSSPPPQQIPMQSTGYSTGGTSELGATAHDPNYPPPNRNELPGV